MDDKKKAKQEKKEMKQRMKEEKERIKKEAKEAKKVCHYAENAKIIREKKREPVMGGKAHRIRLS
jgi:hypothetical protein